jgi:hypothetical protein
LLLGQRASEALTAAGESAFLIIGKASFPSDPSRWVIHLVPVPMATASAACEVAKGHRKPGKRIVPPAIEAAPATALLRGKNRLQGNPSRKDQRQIVHRLIQHP